MDGLTLYLSRTYDNLYSRANEFLSYNISPLCDVAQTSGCGTHCLYFRLQALYVVSPRRPTVALSFRIFRSRSLSDTRLAPVLLFCSFRSRRHSDPRLAPSILFMSDRTG